MCILPQSKKITFKISSLAPKQAMGWRRKHEAGSQVKGVPVCGRKMPGPELTMQEAPQAARVARG